jgi:SH3 domain-containing YSC84-like protein 1
MNFSKANMKINNPLPKDIATECTKCANIITKFIKPETGKVAIDTVIPPTILANAKGVAILTVFKAGFIMSVRAGSGLVVARLPNGDWSAPSAITTSGIGLFVL